MLRGLPASGKTTWSKEFIAKQPTGTWKRLNKDEMRAMIDAGKWSRGNESTILEVRDLLVRKFLGEGTNVIVDDTNFSTSHEEKLREIAKEQGAEFEIKDFDIELDKAIERDLKRPNSVGERVIKRMYYQYVYSKPRLTKSSLHAILCDLDGTLALLNGRNPYDASRCESDLVNEHVANIVKSYQRATNCLVVYMSGREDKYMPETRRWLEKNGLWFLDSSLHMRATGDNRKDSIVKRELFDKWVNPGITVDFVLDDRLQVCSMWHAIGLPLLRVGDPDADY